MDEENLKDDVTGILDARSGEFGVVWINYLVRRSKRMPKLLSWIELIDET